MSSARKRADPRGIASTILSLVRPQATPPTEDLPPASSDALESNKSSRKKAQRKSRDADPNSDKSPMEDGSSAELPPLRNVTASSGEEEDFGPLQMFDSNAIQAPASSQAAESSKKKRRDKGKDLSNSNSPPKKKRKNSDSSDGKHRKKRKSHVDLAQASKEAPGSSHRRNNDATSIIDSIPEENPQDPLLSPSVARAQRRSQSREASKGSAQPNGRDHSAAEADVNESDDDIQREIEAVALEAWQEHMSQRKDAEMAEAPAATEEPAEATTAAPRRARSTRKKSKPTYFDQPVTDEKLDAFGQLPSPSAMTPKPRRGKKAAAKKGSRRQRKNDREMELYDGQTPRPKTEYVQGKFSDDELARLEHAIEAFRSEHDMQQRDVNEMIQTPGGTSAGESHAQLWARIFAEFPDRHRQKVINVSRKRFHNFVARGTWTLDQDKELSDLINKHGQKWSFIAGIINRHPEDIRDRYRNYLVCGGAQRKEAWDNDEEARLTLLVHQAMQDVDDLRRERPDREDLKRSYDELVDWQFISKQMDGTRSRLQCSTKWKSMNLRLQVKDKLVSSEPGSNISFRLEKARRQLEDMPEVEKYRFVLAIHGSMAGTAARIPWQKLCDKKFRTAWHRSTLELGWHRLKQSVPGWGVRTTRDCAQYLVDKYNQDGELPSITGLGFDDEDEMALMATVPFGNNQRATISSAEKLTQADMEGDEPDDVVPEDMQIDPALSEVPRSAQKATPAKRTQNGKRPASKLKKTRASAATTDASSDRDDEEDRAKASEATTDASSDMDDMEDLPARVEA